MYVGVFVVGTFVGVCVGIFVVGWGVGVFVGNFVGAPVGHAAAARSSSTAPRLL